MGSDSNTGPAISTPKGGGAIKGIGETFQPNLFSGTGNFSVPIYTSPCRNDFGPKLSLQYSSGNGNGPFGMGWSLSIPRITRKTEKGLPRYRDEDTFVMSGAEDLVPVLDDNNQPQVFEVHGYKINRYRPRTEGLFARIERWKNISEPSNIHWRVTTKENLTSIYGKSAIARIVDPQDELNIYEWLLEETFDVKGNHILYEYINEANTVKRNYTQTYIRRILYGNTSDLLADDKRIGPVRAATHHQFPAKTKTRHYCFELLFDYFDLAEAAITPAYNWRIHDNNVFAKDLSVIDDDFLRKDAFSSFRASFEIRTLHRCNRVLMLHHFKEDELENAPLVKSTDLNYDINPDTLLSFITSATVTGYRKDPDENARYLSRDMPPVTFKYSAFEPQKQHYENVSAEGGDMPPVSLNSPGTTIMDIFGNGMPDIVQSTPGGFHYWENKGNANIGWRHPQHGNQPPVSFDQSNVSIGDMGGDGLLDMVVDAPPMSGFYEATADGQWKTFKKFKSMPSFNLANANTKLVDLTGDGLSDVLITGDTSFIWYQSKGEQGYAAAQHIKRKQNLEDFPDVYFDDPSGRVRLADMTGDGLSDIVLIHDGRIDYWPNLGYGKFGKRITMRNTPRIGYNYDPRRLFLADVDGSGTADLIYVDLNKVKFWFNQSGNGWSNEQLIQGTPYTTDVTSLQFADFYGTGTSCLIWSYDYSRQPGGNYKLLDFCGRKKPNLLIEMNNNMGATTRAQYASSTKFYLQDKKNGQPWITSLPFPVQVLEKTEVIDHISKTKLVTTYKYHHGYYDGREREFRGFGRVDQYDTEAFYAFDAKGLHSEQGEFTNSDMAYHVPPVLIKNWYHTGIYFDENLQSADGEVFDKQDMLNAYRKEYYQDDVLAFALNNNDIPLTDTPHEAYRVLRGSALRSEVYTIEESDKAKHPYTVTENRYQVKQLQARSDNAYAVYLSVNKESISYQYERNPADPRISQNLTLAYDDYGNITQSASIAYPRRSPASTGQSKIVNGRFTSVKQIDDISGMGEDTLHDIYNSLAANKTGPERESAVLDFFNNVARYQQIVARISDDPDYGSASPLARGVIQSLAKRIIAVRDNSSVEVPINTSELKTNRSVNYAEQKETKIIYTFADFINKDSEEDYYYIGMPCQTRVFEVHGLNWQWKPANELYTEPLKPFAESDFESLNDPAEYVPYENRPDANLQLPVKRLIDWNRQYYRKDIAAGRVDPADFTVSDIKTVDTGNVSEDPDFRRNVAPNAIFMPDNKIWLFYYDRRQGHFELRYMIYDRDLDEWSESIDLIKDFYDLELMSPPFRDEDNNVWVVNKYRDNGKYHLWYKKYNWLEKKWDDNKLLKSDIDYFPTIHAVAGVEGEVWVFMTPMSDKNMSEYPVSYFHYTPDSGWSDQKIINADEGVINRWLRTIKDNEGYIWLFWNSNRAVNGTVSEDDFRMWYKKFPRNSTEGEAEKIIDQPEMGTIYPQPEVDENNKIWVFGIDFVYRKTMNFGYSIFDETRSEWLPYKYIFYHINSQFIYPQAEFEKNGDISIYWNDNRENPKVDISISKGGRKYSLYYNRFDPLQNKFIYKNDTKLTSFKNDNESHRLYPILRDSSGTEWVFFFNWYDDNSSKIQYIKLSPGISNDKLDFADIDRLGLPYESYQACFTDTQLNKIYDDKLDISDIEKEAGYIKLDDVTGEGDQYYWIPGGRQAFNQNKFYQVNQLRDIFGNISNLELDEYGLLNIEAQDALPSPQTNIITAKNNYRVLQPYEVTDPNGNKSEVAFDTLGLVVGTAISGTDAQGKILGDSLQGFVADLTDEQRDRHINDPLNLDAATDSNPHNILKQATTRLVYDLKRYMNTGQPNVVYSLARETHASNEAGSDGKIIPSKIQHSFVYSDGFSREYQSKVQAEPGPIYKVNGEAIQEAGKTKKFNPRWVGTGTKVYNNKGKPVQEYEPFFSNSHLPGIEQHGVSPILFYDPLERVVCTVNPDHTWEKVVFDPWQIKTWDVNDTIHPEFRYHAQDSETTHGFIATPDYSIYENFIPADDKDVGYFFAKLPENKYLPTWYNMRTNEKNVLTLWPDKDNEGNPLKETELKLNKQRRESEKCAALLASKHSATPSIAHLDVLGRPFLSIADNGKDHNAKDHLFKTHVTLDTEGNDLKITDPRGVCVFEHTFDIAGRKLFVHSVDAGDKWLLLSADNQPIKTWDANGNITTVKYDVLRRPVETWVKRPAPFNDTIRTQCIVYGEQLTTDKINDTAAINNHRGQAYLSLDSAGAVMGVSFDFKGNPLISKQVLASEYKSALNWGEVDLEKTPDEIWNSIKDELEDEVFYTSIKSDALNRVLEQTAPDHSKVALNDAIPTDGSIYRNTYNEANLLEKIEINLKAGRTEENKFIPYIENINYDAKGQRENITYANGVITEYEYDRQAYRLMRLLSIRKDGEVLQNLYYTYDPVGNIAQIRDEAIKTLFYNQQKVEASSKYTYDPIYRLATATGREHIAMGAKAIRDAENADKDYYLKLPASGDTQALQMYTEQYRYDDSGNFTELKHHRGNNITGSLLWRRKQNYAEDDLGSPTSNRIQRSGEKNEAENKRYRYFDISHDNNGNMTQLAHLKEINWDHNNRISSVKLDNAGKKYAYYQYDLSGQRVRKVIEKGETTEERLYIGGFEIYRKRKAEKIKLEHHTLHVMDDKNRIAIIEIEGKIKGGEISFKKTRTRYQLNNHLGSSVMEVGGSDNAPVISVEEYYPYGGTSFTGGGNQKEASNKRYKYSGKEKDDETGLYYYGARYYVSWLGRWCSADPAGTIDGLNLYVYTKINPIKYIDRSGTSCEEGGINSDMVNGPRGESDYESYEQDVMDSYNSETNKGFLESVYNNISGKYEETNIAFSLSIMGIEVVKIGERLIDNESDDWERSRIERSFSLPIKIYRIGIVEKVRLDGSERQETVYLETGKGPLKIKNEFGFAFGDKDDYRSTFAFVVNTTASVGIFNKNIFGDRLKINVGMDFFVRNRLGLEADYLNTDFIYRGKIGVGPKISIEASFYSMFDLKFSSDYRIGINREASTRIK